MLIQGIFQKPKLDRTQKEKSVIVRFWRAKGRFKVRDGKLFFYEKEVSLILIKF